MIHRLASPAVVLAVLLAAPGAVLAQQTGIGCALSAISDYSRQRAALYQGRSLFSSPTVEFTLAKQRLRESYCLRKNRCLFGDTKGFFFEQNFAACVHDSD